MSQPKWEGARNIGSPIQGTSGAGSSLIRAEMTSSCGQYIVRDISSSSEGRHSDKGKGSTREFREEQTSRWTGLPDRIGSAPGQGIMFVCSRIGNITGVKRHGLWISKLFPLCICSQVHMPLKMEEVEGVPATNSWM